MQGQTGATPVPGVVTDRGVARMVRRQGDSVPSVSTLDCQAVCRPSALYSKLTFAESVGTGLPSSE